MLSGSFVLGQLAICQPASVYKLGKRLGQELFWRELPVNFWASKELSKDAEDLYFKLRVQRTTEEID